MLTRAGIVASSEGGGGVFTPNYYANSAATPGGDGLSPATAFATVAALQTAALAFGNGVKLALAYGSYWREKLDLSTLTGAQCRAYGDYTQPLPRLDCTNIAANADFSLASTFTYTYQITWANSLPNDIGKNKLRVWENGLRLKWVASTAACEAEAGTFYVTNSSIANPATIYIHPFGSTNPVTDGQLYEITARDTAVDAGSQYDFRYLHTSRNASHNGSFLSEGGGYGYGILSTDGVVHNQWASPAATPGLHRKCVAYQCEPSTWRSLNATLFVSYAVNGGPGVVYDTCYAYDDNAVGNATSAFYGHTNGGAAVLDSVTVENSFSYGATPTISASNTSFFTLRNGWMEWVAGRLISGVGIGASGGINVVDNVTAMNPPSLFQAATNLTATDIRAYMAEAVSGGLFWTAGVDVSNSTFVFNNSITSGSRILFNTTSVASEFENNVVENGAFRTIRAAAVGSIQSDDNVIWTAGGASNAFEVGATGYSFANWQATTGEDGNSAYRVSQGSALVTDPAHNDWTFTNSVVNDNGRASGSRKYIDAPDWGALTAAWNAGYLGLDGHLPPP